MVDDQSTEKTAVVAIYSTRRDAEIARDRLEDEAIRASIVADDAGGAHPELQLTHGIKLVVLGGRAHDARETLKDAGMLPERRPVHAEAQSRLSREERGEDLTFSTEGGLWAAVSWGYIATFFLVIVVIVLGLVLSTFL